MIPDQTSRAVAEIDATPAVLQTRCGILAAGLVFVALSLQKMASAVIMPPLPALVVRGQSLGLVAQLGMSLRSLETVAAGRVEIHRLVAS
ncbi:hypothetical protein HNR46_003825 [Haloferula luteola]|uniref:Uncharacterized protein n=1 Tax=Haloferula luteola TaxID=595692 RepID=A0A840VDH8_9BACT|nr:hypothetical protein [Haloferula luteola]